MKVGVCLWAEGTATLPGLLNSTCTKSGEKHSPHLFNYLMEARLPRSMPPRPIFHLPPPADPRLWAPHLPLLLPVHYKQT